MSIFNPILLSNQIIFLLGLMVGVAISTIIMIIIFGRKEKCNHEKFTIGYGFYGPSLKTINFAIRCKQCNKKGNYIQGENYAKVEWNVKQ